MLVVVRNRIEKAAVLRESQVPLRRLGDCERFWRGWCKSAASCEQAGEQQWEHNRILVSYLLLFHRSPQNSASDDSTHLFPVSEVKESGSSLAEWLKVSGGDCQTGGRGCSCPKALLGRRIRFWATGRRLPVHVIWATP